MYCRQFAVFEQTLQVSADFKYNDLLTTLAIVLGDDEESAKDAK